MRFDTRNMTPQQVADAERQLMPPMTQPFTGLPKSPMQPQVQQPARQLSPVRQYLNAMQQYRQGGRQGVRPTYAQFKQPQLGQQLNGMGQIVQPQNFGIAGGGTGMPPIQPMSDPFKPQISGGPIGIAGGGTGIGGP